MISRVVLVAGLNMEQVRLESTGGTGRKPFKYEGGAATLYLRDQLIIDYHPGTLPVRSSKAIYNQLLRSTNWERGMYQFGRNQGFLKRLDAIYMDIEIIRILCKRASIDYNGGPVVVPVGITSKGEFLESRSMNVQPWPKELLQIKGGIEKMYGPFRYAEAKYYADGEAYMGYHRDHESKCGGPIVSFSLGATRRFLFKHTGTKEVIEFALRNGDVLVMRGRSQDKWRHTLAKQKPVKAGRINVTFRKTLCGMTANYFGETYVAPIPRNRFQMPTGGRDIFVFIEGDVATVI